VNSNEANESSRSGMPPEEIDEWENEAPRQLPDFRVVVHRSMSKPDIDVTFAVMDVYDIAVNSMDFGSGFLSTEEVGNLRALGEAIGAQRFDYQHDKCLRCGGDYGHHGGQKRTRHGCTGFVRPAQ
jgi:hypothetical protein